MTTGGEKMSKSLGNSFFLRDALAKYDGEVIRFYLLGAHYRALDIIIWFSEIVTGMPNCIMIVRVISI